MGINVLLAAVLLACTITDVRTRRIPNRYVFPGMLTALVLRFVQEGADGAGSALLGLLLGMSVLLIPYFMGGMGAGDVKLLGFVGACKGCAFVLTAAVYMALAGALIALAIIMMQKETFRRWRWTACAVYCLRMGIRLPLTVRREPASLSYPYGVAITCGTILCWGASGGLIG